LHRNKPTQAIFTDHPAPFFSSFGMLMQFPHVCYFEKYLQFPLFQCILVYLPMNKFYLIQESGMLIREMEVSRDICSLLVTEGYKVLIIPSYY